MDRRGRPGCPGLHARDHPQLADALVARRVRDRDVCIHVAGRPRVGRLSRRRRDRALLPRDARPGTGVGSRARDALGLDRRVRGNRGVDGCPGPAMVGLGLRTRGRARRGVQRGAGDGCRECSSVRPVGVLRGPCRRGRGQRGHLGPTAQLDGLLRCRCRGRCPPPVRRARPGHDRHPGGGPLTIIGRAARAVVPARRRHGSGPPRCRSEPSRAAGVAGRARGAGRDPCHRRSAG